jgi:hypothetical protein
VASDQLPVISNWQVWRAACWPFPPKNPGRQRQICRTFDRFSGLAEEFYPFEVLVTRHCDRRQGRKAVYVRETGVMVGYGAWPVELLRRGKALARLEKARTRELEEG